MDQETSNTIRLGVFVTLGIILFMTAIYLIGSKNNIFSSTFQVTALFKEVNGLRGGNTVRFRGIDIGTVTDVRVINDSSVMVTMAIEDEIKKNLKKSDMASIGTDGLMGNTLINIRTGNLPAGTIEEHDTLKSVQPVPLNEIVDKLQVSNNNIAVITEELKKTTKKINDKNSITNLLSDSLIKKNIEQTILHIKISSTNFSRVSSDLSKIVKNIKNGKGTMGAVLMDTTLGKELTQTLENLKLTSEQTTLITENLYGILEKANTGEGVIGSLLTDTGLVNNLDQSMKNIRDGSANFNENMKALQHNFLFRRYFKKKEPKKNK